MAEYWCKYILPPHEQPKTLDSKCAGNGFAENDAMSVGQLPYQHTPLSH